MTTTTRTTTRKTKAPKVSTRTLRYDPLTKHLTITVDGESTTYRLERWTHCERPVHAFRFSKLQGGRVVETYDATHHEDTGSKSCDCKGHLKWGHCKHADAVGAIVARDLA